MRLCKKYIIPTILLFSLLACGEQNSTNTTVKEVVPVVPIAGKLLFEDNCSSCHQLKGEGAAPNLKAVIGRWDNDTAKLIAFVKNPKEVIAHEPKNSMIIAMYEHWYRADMPAFTGLSDTAILQILHYTNEVELMVVD